MLVAAYFHSFSLDWLIQCLIDRSIILMSEEKQITQNIPEANLCIILPVSEQQFNYILAYV